MVQRNTVCADRGDDLRICAPVGLGDGDNIHVGNNDVGLAEKGDRTQGEQVRITRARRDQRDRTEGHLATCLRVPWGGACGHGCLS